MFYYKDKRSPIKFMIFRQDHVFMYRRLMAMHRRNILIAFGTLLFVYFLFKNFLLNSEQLTVYGSSEGEVQDDGDGRHIHLKIERPDSSLIIDALIQPAPSDSRPTIYSLINEYKNGMFIYNLQEPVESWVPFECIETKMRHSINTHLCIHDPKFDKYISAQLKENGLWEPTNVRSFLRQLHEVPDANVMDIGANIGLYTMLSAKLNRTVIAVEPLHENLSRLHKAAQIEGVQSRIIALVNALSNERKQLKVSLMDYNIGGSYVEQPELIDPEQKYSPTSSSIIVNSILMDDLVDLVNYKFAKAELLSNLTAEGALKAAAAQNKTTTTMRKFVIKLDIEGYEPFVFDKADRLFAEFQIVAIFMETGKMIEKLKKLELAQFNSPDYLNGRNYLARIQRMLKRFKDLNYEPYEVNGFNKLEFEKWREWPWDVYYRQCDWLNCPGHVYKLSGF